MNRHDITEILLILTSNSNCRMKLLIGIYIFSFPICQCYDITFVVKSRHGRDGMVVVFTSTCAISAYHH